MGSTPIRRSIACSTEANGSSAPALVSGFQTGKSLPVIDTLLVLCPSSDPVPLASHNGRLRTEQAVKFTKSSAATSWQFESMPYSSEPVRLMSAISLEPSELHDNFDLHD